MFAEWKSPVIDEPPVGKPLIVTIHRDWQEHNEVLCCAAYYLKDARDGQKHFFELGNLVDGLIGPESVKVVAWDEWPDAFFPGDAYAR